MRKEIGYSLLLHIGSESECQRHTTKVHNTKYFVFFDQLLGIGNLVRGSHRPRIGDDCNLAAVYPTAVVGFLEGKLETQVLLIP
ncbi:MAG: hypothetical protein BWY79_01236 [Actinobacteria bacterium ADurb.Bin444]|nr:MAG: hypothetical protein BWY79_01236 [Actinobacteria bacterium ADurb.Bin444]